MPNVFRPRTLIAALAVAAALVAGCGPSLPPLSNVTSLSCPDPGLLPFRLDSYSFADPANAMLVKDETRNKDEASDTLGQPSGARANIYIDDAATPAAGDIVYHGKMAVTSPDQGLFTDGVPTEKVSLWSYDSGAWKALGRTTTDGSGYYDLTPSPAFTAANGTPVYAVLEGNGSCTAHFDWLYPSGTKAVVFDIDGTLTTSDDELLMQLSNGSYTPAMMTAANTMVQAWAHKGYAIVYLTARAHTFRAETRGWLDQLGFPPGPVITTNSTHDAQAYKTLWLQRMIGFGWSFVAAYGNATTDIGAYAAVNIPLSATFIIGPNGGMSGTVAIANNDYTSNIASYVDAQPNAN
jgi:hypothetical protein